MLKKKNRLTIKEFENVFKNGKKKFSKNFLYIELKDTEKIKISTTISKKIYKSAVKRVFIRRIIYKILWENFLDISEKGNLNVILVATKPILELDKKEIEKEILQFFNIKK